MVEKLGEKVEQRMKKMIEMREVKMVRGERMSAVMGGK